MRAPAERWSFELARMRAAAASLSQALIAASRDQAAVELGQLLIVYETSFAAVQDAALAAEARRSRTPPGEALSGWVDRLLKVHSTEQRTLHDEVAELLTYSVQASETEQATQNIAIETLKLGNRTADALAARDTQAAGAVLAESLALNETVATLPISPLIQTEMIEASDQWRQGLATTIEGLNAQNQIIGEMDQTASRMIEGARFLDEILTRNAEHIGRMVRTILIFGAAVGLLLGSLTGIAVARSITRPLKRLQQRMMELANDTHAAHAGPIAGIDRRDELGTWRVRRARSSRRSGDGKRRFALT
jgi:hypothetical protein